MATQHLSTGRKRIVLISRKVTYRFLRPFGIMFRSLTRRGDTPLALLADLDEPTGGGSYLSLLDLADALAERGVRLDLHQAPWSIGPSSKTNPSLSNQWRELVGRIRAYRHYDAVLFQHGSSRGASLAIALTGVRVMYRVADMSDQVDRIHPKPFLTLCDSQAVKENQRSIGPHVILHSPVRSGAHSAQDSPGRSITLVNLNEHKGGPLLFELASRCPTLHFLGVRGGWGEQVVPDSLPSNAEIHEYTTKMDDIYSRTAVLLHPSVSEGYPLTPLEALSHGIPVIAHPAPGTVEALGSAALYCDRSDPDAWVHALEMLADSAEYEKARRDSIARFHEHQRTVDAQIDGFIAGLTSGRAEP